MDFPRRCFETYEKMTTLKQTFTVLLNTFTDNLDLINQLWMEIEENYSSANRHYHTLEHLNNLLVQLKEVKGSIKNWSAVLLTLYYHDIIYNPLKSHNEEKSAELAEKRMLQISVDKTTLECCKKQILATKTHLQSPQSDINYFNDADLSVLGQPWEEYVQYYKNVRKEYSWYPDFMYNQGRIKVLNHFLNMERIFKTDYFFNQFEKTSRKNILKEIGELS